MNREVLDFLEFHRDQYISGQDLANKLGVSRAAVWKEIENLRSQGYLIEAKPKKGYRLQGDFDRLSKGGIQKNLCSELKDKEIFIYQTIDSTNMEMKRKLQKGEVHSFDSILSEEQTQGRGRRGKIFESPKHTGLYLTVLWYREGEGPLVDQDLITIKASLAVLRAVKKTTNLDPKIKWVNDLLLGKKKFCGILTEGEFNLENQEISAIYTGIGINLKTEAKQFSKEVRDVATSLNTNILRNDLAAEILNQLYSLKEENRQEVLQAYREASMILGKEVSFVYEGKKVFGRAKDIDEKGHLLVDVQGKTIHLNAGEVSISGDFYH